MPCPPDSERDALLSSDLKAASQDEVRAADLLANAAEGDVGPSIWPTDWLILARRDESRADFSAAAKRYRRYQASLEASGEDTR